MSGQDKCAGCLALEKRVNSLSARLTAAMEALADLAEDMGPTAPGAYDAAAAVQRRRRAMQLVREETAQ